jgi:hypothetical protein
MGFVRVTSAYGSRQIYYEMDPVVEYLWICIPLPLIKELSCYYSIKRQISTKLIGENMFCMKAHQLSKIE